MNTRGAALVLVLWTSVVALIQSQFLAGLKSWTTELSRR